MKNIYLLVDKLILFEKEKGILFNEEGLPIFNDSFFASSLPTEIVPYNRRKESTEPMRTSLCFFSQDDVLYPYLSYKKLEKIATEINDYHSFIGFDLSIFLDMLLPFQRFYILANLVIDIFFILHGNKIIPNLRGDETNGKSYFHLFSDAPIACSSNLGCIREKASKQFSTQTINTFRQYNPNATLIQYGHSLLKDKNLVLYKDYMQKRRYQNGK